MLKANFGSIYFGGMILGLGILMSVVKVPLGYDALYLISQLLMICMGLLYLNPIISELISKQLWRSARVRRWYIAYKEKESRRVR